MSLAGAQQLGERNRVAPVGLDPLARPARDQRRRDYCAIMAERGDQPIEPVTRRTRLVAKLHATVLLSQAPHDPGHDRRRGIDLAEIPHLATALAIRYCNRIPSLGDVDPHERFPLLAHDLSSWAEARLDPPEQPSPSPA